jgi:hypothetical protein
MLQLSYEGNLSLHRVVAGSVGNAHVVALVAFRKVKGIGEHCVHVPLMVLPSVAVPTPFMNAPWRLATGHHRYPQQDWQLLLGSGDPSGPLQPTEALLASLPQLEKELQTRLKLQQAISPPANNSSPGPSSQPESVNVFSAIFSGEHKYTEIKAPCLAIFAVPHDPKATFPAEGPRHDAAVAADLERSTRLSNAFETGVPSAHVVRLHMPVTTSSIPMKRRSYEPWTTSSPSYENHDNWSGWKTGTDGVCCHQSW